MAKKTGKATPDAVTAITIRVQISRRRAPRLMTHLAALPQAERNGELLRLGEAKLREEQEAASTAPSQQQHPDSPFAPKGTFSKDGLVGMDE